jgi:hypothetical protein
MKTIVAAPWSRGAEITVNCLPKPEPKLRITAPDSAPDPNYFVKATKKVIFRYLINLSVMKKRSKAAKIVV